MITKIDLPSGHLNLYQSVEFDTELTGEHHKLLLSSNENLFERTVASVVDSLLTDDFSVYKISFPDLIYLFFIARVSSLGSKIKSEWNCQRIIKKDKIEAECGARNSFTLDIADLKIKSVDKKFSYPVYTFKLKDTDEEVGIFVKLLTVEEEFNCIDRVLEMGYSKTDLVRKGAIDYARTRLIQALSFTDAKYSNFSFEEKDNFLLKVPFSIINEMLLDLEFLTSLGYDLSPKPVKCLKCGGEVLLDLPFSSGFLLPSRARS